MRATELLTQQHRKVAAAFEAVAEAPKAERKAMFAEIELDLLGHMVIEEKIFYPTASERLEDEDLLAEAYEEHAIARFALGRVKESFRDDLTFKARVKVVKELIEHHVEEEESELFPQCEKKFGSELEQLGAQMEEEFEALRSGTGLKARRAFRDETAKSPSTLRASAPAARTGKSRKAEAPKAKAAKPTKRSAGKSSAAGKGASSRKTASQKAGSSKSKGKKSSARG